MNKPFSLVGFWLCCFGLAGAGAAPPEDPQLTEARRRMVQEEIIEAGIENPRVHAAMLATPRHLFVPSPERRLAYLDVALPIGYGQTISPPFIVASMTEQLDPQPTDKVLEIGTGSGYQAAVLGHLVAEVYSIEIVEPLGRRAAETIRKLDYRNVHTKIGDGFQGWAEHAPFDKIIVTCSPERVPPALVAQLKEGGSMVIPLGERYQQTLYRLTKVNGKLETEALEGTFFVPMTGRAEELRQKKDDSGIPEMVNNSFEQADDKGAPVGWYYVRQATIEEDPQAPHGKRVLVFRNETRGRGAQALQSIGLDGRQVKWLELSVWVKAEGVRFGNSLKEVPHMEIDFFDEKRAFLGPGTLGRWQGDIPWGKQMTRVRVPPRARLAVVAIGLFGATGELAVDQIDVQVLDD